MPPNDPLKKLVRIEYLFAALLGTSVLCLYLWRQPARGSESYLAFYAGSVLRESGDFYGYLALFLVVGLLTASRGGWKKLGPAWSKMTRRLRIAPPGIPPGRVLASVISFARIVLPVILNLVLFSYVVGCINSINRMRLVDDSLASVDHAITGSYLFLKLEMIHFPVWFIQSVEFSFVNIPLLLLLIAVVIYCRSKRVFAKYVVAFFTSLVLMVPVWLAVPAMSPQDRFIDDVYHLADPPAIARGSHRVQTCV